MNRLYISFLFAMAGLVSPAESIAAVRIWTGTVNVNWNNPGNWQPFGLPTATDDVVFSGAISNAPCTLPSTVIVNNFTVTAGYSGTITGANNPSAILTVQQTLDLGSGTLSLGRSRLKSMALTRIQGGSLLKGNDGIASFIDLEMLSGMLSFGNGKVEMLDDFSQSGGTISWGTGILTIAGDFAQSGGQMTKASGVGNLSPNQVSQQTGGEMHWGSAAITFGGIAAQNAVFDAGSANVYFNQAAQFNAVTFQRNGGAWYMNNQAALQFSNMDVNWGSSVLNAASLDIAHGQLNWGTGAILATGKVRLNTVTATKNGGDLRLATTDTLFMEASQLSGVPALFNGRNLYMEASSIVLNGGSCSFDGAVYLNNNSAFSKSAGSLSLALGNTILAENSQLDLSGAQPVNLGSLQLYGTQVQTSSLPVRIAGDLEMHDGAVFQAPASAELILEGNFRRMGGTYMHNNGILNMKGSSTFNYTVLGTPDLWDFKIEHPSGSQAKTIEIYGYVNVANNLIFDNALSSSRAIRLQTGIIRLQGDIDLNRYGNRVVNTGNGRILLDGLANQMVLGAPTVTGDKVLPAIRVEKTAGEFLINGMICLGNGFSHDGSTISFDSEAIMVLAGGNFYLNDLLVPAIQVSGLATNSASLAVMGMLEVTASGAFINDNQVVNAMGGFTNNGRYQNNTGSLNLSGVLVNNGDFGANNGIINALAGIVQQGGAFSSNTAQVNILNSLSVTGGRFSCNNAQVNISGSISQQDGEIQGNVNGGVLSVSQSFVQTGGVYDAQNGQLNIAGTLQLSGTFIRNNGTVNFNGVGPQTVPALAYNKLIIAGTGRLITLGAGEVKIGAASGGFVPHTSNFYTTTGNTIHYDAPGNQDVTAFAYNNLSVSRTGQKTVLGNCSLKGGLQIGFNTQFDPDGSSNTRVFTMISNQNQTAYIQRIPSTSAITGKMTVQRWTRGGQRSNRFLASPVDTVGGIKFRQLKDNVPVFGPGNAANGWDNATVFTTNLSVYDEALPNGTEWRSPATINEVLPTGKGMILYHVGDRNQMPINMTTVPNAVTLDFKGVPNQGAYTLPMQCTGTCIEADNGNGWNLVANPYASPIDWMSADWTRSNVSGTIFVWNPRVNQYAVFNLNNPAAAVNGGSRYIGPGQAFFLKATGSNPVLALNENVKSTTFGDTLLFRMAAPQEQLRLLIELPGAEFQDEVVLAFDAQATEAMDEAFDAPKPELPGLALSMGMLNEKGEALAIHTFPRPDLEKADKRIPLKLHAEPGHYIVRAEQLEQFGPAVHFYLEDRYTGITTWLRPGMEVPVEVSSDPASFGVNRLALVLRALPDAAGDQNNLAVWPNPSAGTAVQVFTGTVESGTLRAIDLAGREVWNTKVTSNPTGIVTLQPELEAGSYTLIWESASGRKTARITRN